MQQTRCAMKRHRSYVRSLVFAAAAVVVAACSDRATGPNGSPGDADARSVARGPQIASITLTAKPDTVAAGGWTQITAVVRDNRGEIVHDVQLIWGSANPTVGSVSASGVVTGLAGGNVIVTATSANYVQGWVNVTVLGPPPTPGFPFTFLDGGDSHSCGVAASGDGYCWGWNYFGQLGNGHLDPPTTNIPTPQRVLGGLRFATIDGGGNHTCAVNVNGKAFCWGLSDRGQVGSGLTGGGTTVPVAVAGTLRFSSVTTGLEHSCGVTTQAEAYCWGGNYATQLGTGDSTDAPTPAVVSGGLSWGRVRGGLEHTCGLTTAGRVYCWGSNEFGQLGSGRIGPTHAPTPQPISSPLRFTSVETTASHTCAAATSGESYCWGLNDFGQLGDGTTNRSAQPVRVNTTQRFVSFSLGAHHSCGVTADGSAWCWGYGGSGQVGNNALDLRPYPVAVTGGLQFKQLQAGANVNCGVAADGLGYCWGAGFFGTLGNTVSGDGALSASPVRVARP